MLVHLTPQQATDLWPALKFHIAKALPYGENDKVFGSILDSITRGTLNVLVYTTEEEDSQEFKAVVTTTLNIDHITKETNFVIYTLTGHEGLSEENLAEIQNGLVNFAKGLKCRRIIAYTTNKKVLALAKKLNYKETSTIISLEV